MSKQLQNTIYYGKALENQWRNNIFSSHDLMCGCNNPILHLLIILNREGNAPKPEEDIKNILCLITGEPDTKTGEPEEDVLKEGDLDILFKEDFGEDDGDDPGTSG